MITKIQNNDMSEALNNEISVVDFSATWCMPCKMLEPVIEELSDEMQDNIKFYNVDVDSNPELAMKYDIQGVPSVLIFVNGNLEDKMVGFRPKESIKEFIEINM